MQTTELSPNLVKTNEIIGADVKNAQGESLGKIEEMILNKPTGTVCYVVLSFGGFLGLGDKLFAIPWNAIHYNAHEEAFILDVDKKKLESAPGFDKNNWPDVASQQWGKTIYSYYGTRPYWE